jgi:hypothetical protein
MIYVVKKWIDLRKDTELWIDTIGITPTDEPNEM